MNDFNNQPYFQYIEYFDIYNEFFTILLVYYQVF